MATAVRAVEADGATTAESAMRMFPNLMDTSRGQRQGERCPLAVVDSGPVRPVQQFRVDECDVEIHAGRNARRTRVAVTGRQVAIAIALTGDASIMADDADARSFAEQGVILARPGRLTIHWGAGSVGLLLRLERAYLQRLATAQLRLPKRVASNEGFFACNSGMLPIALRSGLSEAAVGLAEVHGLHLPDLERWLVLQMMCASGDLLVTSQTVQRVMDAVHAADREYVTLPALIRASGVTERWLRKIFVEVTGHTLSAYLRNHRLNWAHRRLDGSFETRSIEQLAVAAGFSSARTFSYAYRAAFDELPAMTRARAVRRAT